MSDSERSTVTPKVDGSLLGGSVSAVFPRRPMRYRDDVSLSDLSSHTTRIDRLHVLVLGLKVPLYPLVFGIGVVIPGLWGWEWLGKPYGVLAGVAGAVIAVLFTVFILEFVLKSARVVPAAILPRRAKLQARRLDRIFDRVLLMQAITSNGHALIAKDRDSAQYHRVEKSLEVANSRLTEVEHELDALDSELSTRYPEWREFLQADQTTTHPDS